MMWDEDAEMWLPLVTRRSTHEWSDSWTERSAHWYAKWQVDSIEWFEQMNTLRDEVWMMSPYPDDPPCAERGPQKLVEAKAPYDDGIAYGSPPMPTLRGIEPGERPVEYLYRKSSMQDRACAHEFANRHKRKIHDAA